MTRNSAGLGLSSLCLARLLCHQRRVHGDVSGPVAGSGARWPRRPRAGELSAGRDGRPGSLRVRLSRGPRRGVDSESAEMRGGGRGGASGSIALLRLKFWQRPEGPSAYRAPGRDSPGDSDSVRGALRVSLRLGGAAPLQPPPPPHRPAAARHDWQPVAAGDRDAAGAGAPGSNAAAAGAAALRLPPRRGA